MNRKLIGLLLAVLALVVFFLLLPEPEAPEPDAWPAIEGNSFVLRGVRVFDGERMHKSLDVLVEGGTITAVSGRVPVPDGIPELAAAGHTLLPGFLDAHTHNFGASRAEALRFGVTTQIDMFTAHTALADARAQRESSDRVEGADMWSAGTLVTAPGGHGTQFGMQIPTLSSAADAPAFIAARVAEGSDFIKLVVEGGSAWSAGIPTLDAATLAAAVTATHSHGKLAVAHAGNAVEARAAIDAGADGLAHVFHDEMPEGLLDAIVTSGAFVVPTLTVMESLAGRPSGLGEDARLAPFLDPAQADGLARLFPGTGRTQVLDHTLSSVRALHEAGVTIIAGSDAPNPGTAHGASLHRELELLVEAGLSPAEALAAATSVPAARFAIPGRGRVARGMRADLVLVAGDPLADITATRAIRAVFKNGFLVPRDRFDGSAMSAAPPAPAELGMFDAGDDGWIGTTDSIMGGASTVSLAFVEGVLSVDAEVRAGSPFPWAGAMRWFGPADASAFDTLTLRIRGTGTVQLLFFAGASEQAAPISMPLPLEGGWQDLAIDLRGVAGLDRARLRAVGVVAGPGPGTAHFELDTVVLR